MAFKLSTGAKINILANGFVTPWQHCAILIFSGTPPTNPDNGITSGNTLLALAAQDPDAWAAGGGGADGITWQVPDAAGLVKATGGITVVAKGLASGLARWFWIVQDIANGDDTGASLVIPRIQGIAGVGSGDLLLTNAQFEVGTLSNADVNSLIIKMAG